MRGIDMFANPLLFCLVKLVKIISLATASNINPFFIIEKDWFASKVLNWIVCCQNA
jgi:hypothetical protein